MSVGQGLRLLLVVAKKSINFEAGTEHFLTRNLALNNGKELYSITY